MKKYKQLNLIRRYEIELLLSEGYNQSQIAKSIGVHKSTISREFKRNVNKRGNHAYEYSAERANHKTVTRERQKNRRMDFTVEMKEYMREQLRRYKWSPEIICVMGKEKYGSFVSAETMYQYIWKAKKSNHKSLREDKYLFKHLRHIKRSQKRSSPRKKRGMIPNRTPISERPEFIEERNREGDLEVDLMMGSNHKAGLLVIVDRSTLETDLVKLKTKQAKEVREKLIKRLSDRKNRIHTLTFDNGLEFAEHEKVAEALEADTYFARPYTSQDKGTVENKIGVLRRFFPKGSDMSSVKKSRIKKVENNLNNRPVRKFGYFTPREMNEYLNNNVALVT